MNHNNDQYVKDICKDEIVVTNCYLRGLKGIQQKETIPENRRSVNFPGLEKSWIFEENK